MKFFSKLIFFSSNKSKILPSAKIHSLVCRPIFYIFWLGFFCAFKPIQAATWHDEPEGTIGVKLGMMTPALSHEFKSENKSIVTLPQYVPYTPPRIFTEINYSYYSLSLSAPTSTNEKDNSYYGATSTSNDFQFRIYMRQHNFDLFLQDYSGFYLKNSESVDNSLSSSSQRLQRPDMKTTHVGLQYVYVFDQENYSLGSSFSQTTIQTESGGSWLAIAGINQKILSADLPFIPAAIASQYGEVKNFKGGIFNTVKVGGGYGYNLVYKQFYLAGVALLTTAQQDQNYDLAGQNTRAWRPARGGNFKLGLGYNGDFFHAGAQFLVDADEISLAEVVDSITTYNTSFFVAYRF